MISVRPDMVQHSQETPEIIWEVPHSMKVTPSVTVVISINGVLETILPKSIKHESNLVLIEFSKPRVGKATLS